MLPALAEWTGDTPLARLQLRRGRALLTGVVHHPSMGRVAYAHNPWQAQALVLLSRRAEGWLDAADGRSVQDVVAALPEAAERERWLRDLQLLLRNGVLDRGAVPLAQLLPMQPEARPGAAKERVFNAWLHLTNACNLACPYCYIHKSKRHLSGHVVETLLAAIEDTAKSGQVDRIHIRYAGGEPMLRFAEMQRFHADALARCAPHGVRYSAAVLTNGTALRPESVAWLREEQLSVSVSIDGVGDAQDRMRPVVGGGSSWQRVQAGIELLLHAGITPYILITVGDSNLDGLPELTGWLLERGLAFRYSLVRDLSWGTGLLDDRRGAAEADGGPSREAAALLEGPPLRRLQGVLGQCYDLIEARVAAAIRDGHALPGGFRRSHRFCDLSPWQPIRQACGAGSSYLAIGEEGGVSPCQAALHETGTRPLQPSNLLSGASAAQFQPFVRDRANPVCQDCRHRPSCAGGCPLLLHRREGHVNGRSPYCEVFRTVLPRIVRIGALELAGERLRHAKESAHA